MKKTDLRKFMSGGVAENIDSIALWNGLERLRTDGQMVKNDLKTLCRPMWFT